MKRFRISEPLRLALKYILIAALWIIVSDSFIAWGERHSFRFEFWSMFKGLVFVLVTGGILYVLAQRMQRRICEVEESKQAELLQMNQGLQRAKGLLAARARANQATLNAREEVPLCREIGEALVGLAGLRFVWFGWVNEDSRRVEPSAWAGDAASYLDGFICSVDPADIHGQGPTGRAIREGRVTVCPNIPSDVSMNPWRDRLEPHGFKSSVSMPFRLGDRRGVFKAYAGQEDFFDAELIDLLGQLAADLEHGLEWIAARTEREGVSARLRESEARYRALFANDSVALLLVDAGEGRVYDANPAALRYLGWAAFSPGEKIFRDLGPRPAADLLADLRQASTGGQKRFQVRLLRADGEARELEVFAAPVRIDEHDRLCLTLHDITERVRAERELADALTLNELAMNASPLGMVIFDAEGRVARSNLAAARIVAASPDELVLHDLKYTAIWTESGLSDTAARALSLNRAQSSEARLPGPREKDVLVAATFTPFRFHEERQLLATLDDVTDRRRVLARLHLMQAAIEAAPNAILITDAQGLIEWVNPAFTTMTGYSFESVAGRAPSVFKSGRQGPAFYAALWTTISSGQVWSGELQNVRRDGSVYWERMVIAPVFVDAVIRHYVAIKQDISAQKEMERQVARTQRLESIGLLAGGIAHDLNNVLAPILLAIDILKLSHPSPVEQRRLEMVRSSAERGAAIVRQVLTFARGVEGERMHLQVGHVIKEVRNLLRETLPRLIDITVDLEAELPDVIGDATQLHQVLLNLGVNARDAMPQGGVLAFGARVHHLAAPLVTVSGLRVDEGDYLMITVRDTGEGIAPSVMEHMFEPFYTTKPRGAGTGLGLSTVLGIVRGHGGGLDVSSQLGKGSEFRILLPVAPKEARFIPAFIETGRLSGEGRSILVVDDEAAIREITALVLEHHGFAHVEAADGRAALDIFEAEPGRFSAVILDQVMPHIGGDVVAARIKAINPRLPIILISGLLSDGGVVGGSRPPISANYRKYGDYILQKPFTQAELIAALGKVLPRV